MNSPEVKNALVTVLDWGLGHATRCVPVIRELQKQNINVVVGGGGLSLIFLKEEFPALTFYPLPSYGVVYPESNSMWFSILKQLPKVFAAINQEKKAVDEILGKEKIDIIISDNRYGCFSKKVKSIFVGHQLNLQMPAKARWLSKVVNRFHSNKIKAFDEVWIPDEADGAKPNRSPTHRAQRPIRFDGDDNLKSAQAVGFSYSGVLSEIDSLNTKRIGILSRFGNETKKPDEIYDIVALISGPEPQRTIFENLCRQQLITCKRKSLMIKGKPGTSGTVTDGLLTEVGHLPSQEMESVLKNCQVVISRSGYSTIMDLATLNKKAFFIPTPGQTEQEYLAEHLVNNKMAFAQPQSQFDLEVARSEWSGLAGSLSSTGSSGR